MNRSIFRPKRSAAGGDALKLTDTTEVKLEGGQGAEVLVFDLPGEAAAH